MICGNPFRRGVEEYPCGKCDSCRVTRRRLWTTRLLLEAQNHSEMCFVTLTYSDEKLPPDRSVQVRDVQLFLKRLRERTLSRLRYFAVGEYGDHTFRPHYHVLLFGTCDSNAIAAAWDLGFVHVGLVTEASILYTCKYSVKGFTSGKNEKLGGRKPEFARMSLKPGIGALAAGELARATTTRAGARFVAATGDVPGTIRIAGKRKIGRYLTRKVREELGMDGKRPALAAAISGLQRRSELLQPGAREAREDQRQRSVLSARARHKIGLLKKGMGL